MARHVPERTCILTRATLPQDQLIRFTLSPDGTVVADLRHRLPGRGAWLMPTAAALGEAVKRRAFARAFKREVQVPDDLVGQVDAALVRDLLGALSMANKAGAITTGFTKVAAALRSRQAAVLIHAREAQADGRRKLSQALHSAEPRPIFSVLTYDDLSGDELDMALGRVHVIHAALLAGEGSRGCLVRWRSLRQFRGLDGAGDTPRDADIGSKPADAPERGPDGQDRDLDE